MIRSSAAAPLATRPWPAAPRRLVGPALCGAAAAPLLALLLAAPLAAQAPTVDSIAVVRQSVFDTDEATFWLLSLVNTLHVTTQPWVIRRELLVHPGDRYDSARVAESARNLRSLGVFRSVEIDTATVDTSLVMTVTTRDGWSTRPDFRFRSTGGELDYTLAMIEDNLLGTATQASVLYRKNPDRSTTTLGFRQRRLIGGRIGLAARYDNRSDGDRAYAVLNRPFFTLEERHGWGITGETRSERILRFADGRLDPVDSVFRDYRLGRLDYATALRADSRGYLRLGVAAQVRNDNVVLDRPIAGNDCCVSGAIGVWLEARRARYRTVTGYNAQGRAEDIDLSTVARLGAWIAPAGLGYGQTGVGGELLAQTGVALSGGFLQATGYANGLFTSAGLDSGSVQLGATAAWLPNAKHLAVAHVALGALERQIPGTEFDLGLGAGPRGFRQHAFTGDRMFFATGEYRYALATDFLKVVDVGLAAFGDAGGAWYRGRPSRSGWDAGIGLRLGASRAPDLEANRIDLVYRSGNDREPAGWVLVVAKGFAFTGALRGDR